MGDGRFALLADDVFRCLKAYTALLDPLKRALEQTLTFGAFLLLPCWCH